MKIETNNITLIIFRVPLGRVKREKKTNDGRDWV